MIFGGNLTTKERIDKAFESEDKLYVKLNGMRITDDNINYILEKLTDQMTKLQLQLNEITNKGLQKIVMANLHKITFISLFQNKIDYEGCKYLTRAPWKNLQNIIISYNQINDKGVKLLTDNVWTELKSIGLNNCEISDVGISHLAKAQWKNLQKIKLSDNTLERSCLKNLMKGNWKKLISIDLSWNKIKFEGALHFFEADWPNLQQFWISIPDQIKDITKCYILIDLHSKIFVSKRQVQLYKQLLDYQSHQFKLYKFMKILIDIQTIKGSFSHRDPIRIKLKIGDMLSIWTEYSHCSDNVYAFLQKHLINLQQKSVQSYIQVSIVGQNGSLLGQITVFLDKFKEFNSIDIKRDQDNYKLSYSLKEIADDSQQIQLINNRASKKIEEQPPNMNEQANKLQIFRLGILMFNFAQRLDPLVYVYNKIVAILLWKNPLNTIGIGILLTIAIFYMKTSILLVGICLYFGKDLIFKKLSTIHKYKNFHKRLIVPKQNAYFLQHGMDNYCQLYENITTFLFNDDKTLLINLIKFICKTFIMMILLLSFFTIQSIVVLTLWTLLILNSPFNEKIKNVIKPVFNFLIGEYDKIFDKITLGISNIIGNPINMKELQISKVFYYYHYERWWVVKGWCDQTKKYSDQKYQAILFPRQKAPEGWGWIQQWKIDCEGDVDSYGYQYSNDLINEFKSNSALMTRRRRKWKRTCVKLHDVI